MLQDGLMVLRVCMKLAKEMSREDDSSSFATKRSGVANTWFELKEQRKITYSMDRNKTEIDFVLIAKNNRKYSKDVKAIPCKLQHRLVVTDIDKRKLKKVVKKKQTFGEYRS